MTTYIPPQWTEDQLRVARNIAAIADKYHIVPKVVMLASAIQESQLNENAVNIADAPAYGGSVGIFQLNQDPAAHPGTALVAQDPWYDYGYPEIRARWENAWHYVGGWSTFVYNPVSTLQTFAPMAQGSIGWSYELAAARLTDAVDILGRIE